MTTSQRLPAAFYRSVQAELVARLVALRLDAVLTDDPQDVAYLTGFFHHPHERPVAVAVLADATAVLLVPELEREHAEEQGAAAELVSYEEFPGVVSPWAPLLRRIRGRCRRIAHPGSLTVDRHTEISAQLPGVETVASTVLAVQRAVKRPEELELHRRAAHITDRMLRVGRRAVEDALVGGGQLPSEAELAGLVSGAGVSAMYDEDCDIVVVTPLAGGLVYSGENSARPHRLPSGDRLQRGESFMLSLGCAVGGRFVEGERTFFLGAPDPRRADLYETVREAHAAGAAAIAPGVQCRQVDDAGREVMERAGLLRYRRHRQGHGIGLGMHEAPWVERGDDTELVEGMVASNEPGLYVPGLAGFRISDSVLVTASGSTTLTSHPRELADVVIDA